MRVKFFSSGALGGEETLYIYCRVLMNLLVKFQDVCSTVIVW